MDTPPGNGNWRGCEGDGAWGPGGAGGGVCEVGVRTEAVELGVRGAEDSGADWYRGTSQDGGAQGMEDRAASGRGGGAGQRGAAPAKARPCPLPPVPGMSLRVCPPRAEGGGRTHVPAPLGARRVSNRAPLPLRPRYSEPPRFYPRPAAGKTGRWGGGRVWGREAGGAAALGSPLVPGPAASQAVAGGAEREAERAGGDARLDPARGGARTPAPAPEPRKGPGRADRGSLLAPLQTLTSFLWALGPGDAPSPHGGRWACGPWSGPHMEPPPQA